MLGVLDQGFMSVQAIGLPPYYMAPKLFHLGTLSNLFKKGKA